MMDLKPISEMTPEEYEEFLHEGCAHPYCLWFPEDWKGLDQEAEQNQDFILSEAQELRECGTLEIYRNDETGPDEYQEGVTMPGLGLEGVRQELEGT